MQHCPCQLLHVIEPWVDRLIGLFEHLDKLLGLFGVGRGKEGVCCTSVLSSSRTANAMNIVLRVSRKVIIYDILNVGHILFSSSQRGGHYVVRCKGEMKRIVQSG